MVCPQCHKNVTVSEAQYGALYTCPQCSAVYFVNFDGQPEYGDTQMPEAPEPTLLSSESDVSPIHVSTGIMENPLLESGSDFNHFTSLNSNEESTLETHYQDQLYPHLDSASFESHANTPSQGDLAGASLLGAAIHDIQQFGNQDQPISNLNYDLIVSGMDNKETLIAFKEALQDSRFGWFVDDILHSVHQGKCVIKNLDAVKSSVLAKRLRFLDLDMKWIQNVETS